VAFGVLFGQKRFFFNLSPPGFVNVDMLRVPLFATFSCRIFCRSLDLSSQDSAEVCPLVRYARPALSEIPPSPFSCSFFSLWPSRSCQWRMSPPLRPALVEYKISDLLSSPFFIAVGLSE